MQKWTKPPASPVRIAVLVFDQFSNLCLANCIEPLRAANTLTASRAFEWRILGIDGGAVRSSSGIDILAGEALGREGPNDYLFVLASYGHERHDTAANRRLLRAAARRARVTVGLDTGPWLLAAAGLMAGRRATVHWDVLDAFSERFLDVEAVRARVVRDGPVLTCAGAISALDLTLDLIAETLGLSARLDVEALFIRDDPPEGVPDPVADPLVRRALALMRETVERPLPLTRLAQRLSCQPRTLDRRFRARPGAAPGTVYRHLRLAAARKLIEESALPVAEIALRCGYDSPAALARAVRRTYGAAPTALRSGRGA
ncbi:MAG: helix-turn-helix domain-containing protein [Roseovarius sp.]|nr:helix-turn-helix domain-containing protein [Roseovarius sp.]